MLTPRPLRLCFELLNNLSPPRNKKQTVTMHLLWPGGQTGVAVYSALPLCRSHASVTLRWADGREQWPAADTVRQSFCVQTSWGCSQTINNYSKSLGCFIVIMLLRCLGSGVCDTRPLCSSPSFSLAVASATPSTRQRSCW